MEDHSIHISSENKSQKPLTIKWLVFCLGLIITAFIAVAIFKISPGSLFYWGVILACPLMHVWMMRDGEHKH